MEVDPSDDKDLDIEDAEQDKEELEAEEDPSEELILTSPSESKEEDPLEGPLPS